MTHAKQRRSIHLQFVLYFRFSFLSNVCTHNLHVHDCVCVCVRNKSNNKNVRILGTVALLLSLLFAAHMRHKEAVGEGDRDQQQTIATAASLAAFVLFVQ